MIIGITGWFASGKDTVADYLQSKGFESVSLSDIIRDHLRAEKQELTRENLLAKGNELRSQFGTGYLAEQALKKLQQSDSANWVIPAVRQSGEVSALKSGSDFQLWSIDAPIEIRFSRMKKRAKGGEDDAIKTVDDLKAKEKLENGEVGDGPQINIVVKMADVHLNNSGTFKELYVQIDKLIGEENDTEENRRRS